ncbi:MAG: chorismate lyase [Burkholderiales bacterium]|nr:chorismate lyase [Burkholderiales bacterium]
MSLARWYAHTQGCGTPQVMRHWLADKGSLTLKLRARCQQFRVKRLHQQHARCLRDEAGVLGLAYPQQTWEREVLLYCDQMPMVFAHTVVPLAATANDWPLFSALGERSLGTTLFGDPLVQRGKLHFARLTPPHPLFQRALLALQRNGIAPPVTLELFARRCLYRRKQGLLLVTEVFLPWISELAPPAIAG